MSVQMAPSENHDREITFANGATLIGLRPPWSPMSHSCTGMLPKSSFHSLSSGHNNGSVHWKSTSCPEKISAMVLIRPDPLAVVTYPADSGHFSYFTSDSNCIHFNSLTYSFWDKVIDLWRPWPTLSHIIFMVLSSVWEKLGKPCSFIFDKGEV